MWICEALESRVLLDGFLANVNFQPAGASVPAGYVADDGAIFADRGNGLSYGWNTPKPAKVTAREHGKFLSSDERYNAFAVMNTKGRGSSWQIAVPNGDYQLELVAGDPQAASGRYRILANGGLVLDGRASRSSRWVSGSGPVTVTDGTISLTVPRGAHAKLDFVEISQVNSSGAGGGGSQGGGGSGGTTANGWTSPFSWGTKANAPQPLAEAQSVVAGGRLFVFGGYYVTTPDYQPTNASEVYDPASDSWTTLAPMPAAETHMGVATDGSSIYVAGGYTFDRHTTFQTFATSNVFRYDIASNTWSTFAPLPAARGAGALVYLNGELHFFDGVDTSRMGRTDHWVLNPSDSTPHWSSSTPLPFSRNHMSGVVLDGVIYAVGGQSTDDDSSTTTDVLRWDPANPSMWTPVASLPYRLSHAVVTAINGRIVVAGGTTANDVPLSNVISYNPATNTWTAETPLPSARLAGVGGAIDSMIVFATGFGNNSLQAQTWLTPVI